MRDVQAYSARIARRRGDRRYLVPFSRLYDIEKNDLTPSIFRVYSLASIYHVSVDTILQWYGVSTITHDMDRGPLPL